MRLQRLFFVLVSLSALVHVTQAVSNNPRYIRDEHGKTLIFRTHLDKLPFVGGLSCLAIIPILELCAKKPIELGRRILLSAFEVPFACLGTYAVYSYFIHYYRFNQPLIVLDEQGIWHEAWERKILWSDVTQIDYEQRHEYITYGHEKNYQGYSWQIMLHTKQKEKYLINTRLIEQLHAGHDPEKNRTRIIFGAGGLVGQLIREHHDSYKRVAANNSDMK